MCFSKKPDIPAPPEPLIIPPEDTKKIELNPGRETASGIKQKKRKGTRSLQIPMGGTKSGAGLKIPV